MSKQAKDYKRRGEIFGLRLRTMTRFSSCKRRGGKKNKPAVLVDKGKTLVLLSRVGGPLEQAPIVETYVE